MWKENVVEYEGNILAKQGNREKAVRVSWNVRPCSLVGSMLLRNICTYVRMWVPVTTAWRVLRLRMEERPADMEGSCEYME